MPRLYPLEVRVFAAQRRTEGHSWDRVAELVQQRFGLDRPPSRRQMSKWAKEITPSTLAGHTVREMQRRLPAAASSFLSNSSSIIERVMAAGLAGEDVGKMLVKWMLEEAKTIVGPQRFEEALAEFQMKEAEKARDALRREVYAKKGDDTEGGEQP
jgi:hypothetical protein